MGGWHIGLQRARCTWRPARPDAARAAEPRGRGPRSPAGSARRLRARSRPSARPLRPPRPARDPAGTDARPAEPVRGDAHGRAGAPRSGSASGMAAPGASPAAEPLARLSREGRTTAPGPSLRGRPVEENALSFKVSASRSPGQARPQTRRRQSAFSPAERRRDAAAPGRRPQE